MHEDRSAVSLLLACLVVAIVLWQLVGRSSKRVREATIDGVWLFGSVGLTIAIFYTRSNWETYLMPLAISSVAIAVIRYFTAKRA